MLKVNKIIWRSEAFPFPAREAAKTRGCSPLFWLCESVYCPLCRLRVNLPEEGIYSIMNLFRPHPPNPLPPGGEGGIAANIFCRQGIYWFMNLFNPPGSLCSPHFGKAYFGRLTSAGLLRQAQHKQHKQHKQCRQWPPPLRKGGNFSRYFL